MIATLVYNDSIIIVLGLEPVWEKEITSIFSHSCAHWLYCCYSLRFKSLLYSVQALFNKVLGSLLLMFACVYISLQQWYLFMFCWLFMSCSWVEILRPTNFVKSRIKLLLTILLQSNFSSYTGLSGLKIVLKLLEVKPWKNLILKINFMIEVPCILDNNLQQLLKEKICLDLEDKVLVLKWQILKIHQNRQC